MKKIIIVESDAVARQMYATLLRKEKFDVQEATDGKQGLALVQKVIPDLVLLELLLPKMDGFEVVFRISQKKTTQDIPVVVFTELGHQDDLKRCAHLGAKACCVKAHHTSADVVKKVKEVLAA